MVLRSCVRWFSLSEGLWHSLLCGSLTALVCTAAVSPTGEAGRTQQETSVLPRTACHVVQPDCHRFRWAQKVNGLPGSLSHLQATRAIDSPWQSETNAHASCTVGGIGGGDSTTPWCAETSWATRAGVRPATGPVTSHNLLPDACLPGPYLGMVGWLPVLRDAIVVSRSN